MHQLPQGRFYIPQLAGQQLLIKVWLSFTGSNIVFLFEISIREYFNRKEIIQFPFR
jgi:hypothetical protein